MTEIRNEYRRLRFFLIAAYVVLAAGTAATAAWYLHSEYRHILQVAQAHGSTLTRALEEHVLRTFTAIDIQLRNTGRRLVEMRALERPSTPAMVELLRQEKPEIDFVRSLYVYDASGRGHTTSLGADISKMHARNFEHFREILESGTDRLVVGRVTAGAVTRRPSIPIARGILGKDGRFAGIIGTAIEPAYFEEFYTALNLEPGASLVLIRTDGAVLVRVPEAPNGPKDVSGTQVFRDHLGPQDAGVVDTFSTLDGARRIVSFRRVPGWNLIVANTQLYAAVIAPWWRIAWAVGLLAIGSLLIFFVLLRLALVELARRGDAERDLYDSERKYRELLEQAADAIFVADGQERYVEVNRAACEMLGYSREELLALTIRDLLSHEDLRNAPLRLDELRAGNSVVSERRLRRKDGTFVTVELNAQMLSDGRLQAVTRDLTDRKRAEQALSEANERLEQRVQERTAKLEAANKELETFTYSVAHDLKAPLRGIDGYSRLLLEGYADRLDDEGRQFLHNVRRAAQQMDQLTNDLLAYSRLERRDVQLGQMDPQALIEALLAERAADIQARGVAVSVAVPCPSVSADREGLTMALRNLLENALKFTRDTPHPVIEVGGGDQGTTCLLWVRDNGVGFDMKYHERIFTIFQRLHRSEDYPGTGVGLAIVRKAMERMGGRAWAESEPGKGATFYLEIPK